MTNYPGGLDTFTNRVDDQTVLPGWFNDIQDAIAAIQAELGTDPAGAEATVKDRFSSIVGSSTGEVKWFAGTSVPSGYLECDGSAVSRTTYSALFSAIGTAHGEGDGSTTFNLPDLRGKFIRGHDNTAGNDPDAGSRTAAATGGNTGDNVGSVQNDAFQGHYHNFWHNNVGSGIQTANGNSLTNGSTQANQAVRQPVTDGANGTPRTASETRPKNVALMPIIKT